MHRTQIYLQDTHIHYLSSYAQARSTTQSALVREALDEYLARQAPLDVRAQRSAAFGAWQANDSAPDLRSLRSEERVA